MSNQRYTSEFKDEAVRQVVERGYPVAEVAEHPSTFCCGEVPMVRLYPVAGNEPVEHGGAGLCTEVLLVPGDGRERFPLPHLVPAEIQDIVTQWWWEATRANTQWPHCHVLALDAMNVLAP